jgi:hypothetical protein
MNREVRREIKVDAKKYLSRTQAFVLVYLDKEGRFQCIGDVSTVPDKDNTFSQEIIRSLFHEAMRMTKHVRDGEKKEREVEQQSEKTQEAKEARSLELSKMGEPADQKRALSSPARKEEKGLNA